MRRSAATVAANGASLETLKKIGRWNSSNVPSLYFDKSGIDTWNPVQQTISSRTSISMDASTNSSSMRTMFHVCRIWNINIYIKDTITEDSVKESNNITPNFDTDIFQEIPSSAHHISERLLRFPISWIRFGFRYFGSLWKRKKRKVLNSDRKWEKKIL